MRTGAESRGLQLPSGNRRETDAEHRECGVMQDEDQRGGDDGCTPKPSPTRRGATGSGVAPRLLGRYTVATNAIVSPAETTSQGAPSLRRMPHQRKRGLWAILIRFVRLDPGQKERSAVCHEQRAVEEGPLVMIPLPRRVKDDPGHEHHCRIEVQESRHDRIKCEQRREEHDWPPSDPLNTGAYGFEEAICLDHCADEEQACDQNKRRPGLTSRMKNGIPHRDDATAGVRASLLGSLEWTQPGSNRRPLACHASALPAELWARETRRV